MLNHKTLLAWTNEIVKAANVDLRGDLARRLELVVWGHTSNRADASRVKLLQKNLGRLSLTTFDTRFEVNHKRQLELAAPQVKSADVRAALTCIELLNENATVKVAKCRRKDCGRYFIKDFGSGTRKHWYCLMPNGERHKLDPTERSRKSRSGDVSDAAMKNRIARKKQSRTRK